MGKEGNAPGISRRSWMAGAALVPAAALPAADGVFPPAQKKVLEAFVERLIPTDENGPGAVECGVVRYLELAMEGALAREKAAFLDGLAAVDSYARRSHGQGFANLKPAGQDAVLTAMEENSATGFSPDARTFFQRVRQLTLEGMFCDPFYGGNLGFAGWDLIRYPGPRMAVSPSEQRLKEPIKPLRKSAHGGRHGD